MSRRLSGHVAQIVRFRRSRPPSACLGRVARGDTKLPFCTAYDFDWDPYIEAFATKIPDILDLQFMRKDRTDLRMMNRGFRHAPPLSLFYPANNRWHPPRMLLRILRGTSAHLADNDRPMVLVSLS